MARGDKIDTSKLGGTAVEDGPESGEQGNMFPDLDSKKPEDKKLIKLAKEWIAIVDERREFLEDAKEREDKAHEAMVTQAKALGLERFAIAGREITIEHKDKAKVKAAKVSDGDDDKSDE